MDPNIKLSIILPVYNGGTTLSKAIDSVLNQSYKNFELLVINDGSQDNTEEVLKLYSDSRIVHIKNESNLGLIKTLNKGVAISKGDFIARIDSDDTWIDMEKISKQITFLEENKDYVLIGTQAIFRNNSKTYKTHYPLTYREIKKSILSKNPFLHSSVIFRKNILSRDPYQEGDYLVEDYSLWLRLGLLGKFANLSDYSLEYFVNPNGETQKNNLKQTLNSLKLIKKYKEKYPGFYVGYLIWNIKVLARLILLYLK